MPPGEFQSMNILQLTLAACVSLAATAPAADYPARPIRIIVAYTPAAPDLPTVGESVPGFSAASWFGLAAPKGTPKVIVDKLSAETARILKLPDVNERLSGLGAQPIGSTPAAFAAFIQSETVKWAKVIKDANVELQ